MKEAKEAKELLVYYLRLAAEGANIRGHDNQSEIEWIVDLIVAAATDPLEKEIERLNQRISNLETANLKRRNGETD